jgi:hypothetical protein
MIAHDSGYKRLFSHPEMIRDLLIGFVCEPWIAELDFATLEKYPGEVIDDRLRPRRNDVIWRLRCGPDWLYVYVLLEFQSGVHPFMAARLSTYLDLLYQDLIRGRQLGRRRRLPPVLPIVLYNGRRRWTAPTDLADLIEPGPAGLDAYRPRLRYLLIDESAYADAQLAPMRNLAAALFRLENSRGPEPVRAVLSALAEWLADPEQMELRRSFVIWLHEAFFKTRLPAVQFPELSNLEEIRIMLTDRVLDWTQQWKQEGPATRPSGRFAARFAARFAFGTARPAAADPPPFWRNRRRPQRPHAGADCATADFGRTVRELARLRG